LANTAPEVYERTHTFLEPKDWLGFMLTGERAASHDSIALHWVTDNRDISNVHYHPALLRMTGIDRHKLPELRRSTDVLGKLRPQVVAELGLAPETVVVCGTPDVHSAAIGSGAVRDFEGHLYVGTSSWITCHVPFKRTDLARNMASIPSGIPGRYFVANAQETAGACLTFLRDNLLARADELAPRLPVDEALRAFDTMAERAPAGSRGLLFLPWLWGERTPIEDPTIRGGFFNLGLDATRDEFVRAVFEGVAYNARWLLESVERFIGRPFPSLRFIGGGARSQPWAAIFADVLDRPIDVVLDPVSANARGAALLAFVALGEADWDDIPARVAVARRFEPRAEHRGAYERLYLEFREFYRNNRRAHRRLNRT
jgi:xylulokinase